MINISNIQNNNQEEEPVAGVAEFQENIMNEIDDIQGNKKISANGNIVIHTMPKKFHSADSKRGSSKKTGLVIIIGGAALLLAIFGGMYYYLFMNDAGGPDAASRQEDSSSQKEPTAADQKNLQDQGSADQDLSNGAAGSGAQDESIAVKPAKEMYLYIKAELDQTKDFYDYAQVIEKYGSRKRLAALNSQKSEYSGLTAAERSELFISLAKQAPDTNDIEDIAENMSGNTAILSVKVKNISEKAIIKMASEDGEWKLESENWPKAEKQEVLTFKSGMDSDQDGLTDKEEELLGCDPNMADSDGDSYGDLSELMNLYNPAGAGNVLDNENIRQYFNGTFGYSAFYPGGWPQSSVGGDESIIFKSSDNHFIQIMSQPNAEKIQIEDWYNKQFDTDFVQKEKKVIAENWRGIKSEDGLIVYLADNSLNYIFIITYNPGLDDTLEYVNIFEIAIKSFEVK